MFRLLFKFIKKIQTCFQTMQIMHVSFIKECTISMQDINGSKNATVENKSKQCINFFKFIIMQNGVLEIIFQSFKHFKFLHKWTTQTLVIFNHMK